jgi:hypothetical protein
VGDNYNISRPLLFGFWMPSELIRQLLLASLSQIIADPRLSFSTPLSDHVHRHELFHAIQNERRQKFSSIAVRLNKFRAQPYTNQRKRVSGDERCFW